MTWINGAARTLLPALAIFAILFVATALTLPQPAQAQANCVGCLYIGSWNIWNGEGYDTIHDIDCISQPEGMSECRAGSSAGVPWCETSGSMCQALMFLDFSEDGTARWNREIGPSPRPHEGSFASADRTCDGIWLQRGNVTTRTQANGPYRDDQPGRPLSALTLAL